MPITIKQNVFKYKNPTTGQYQSVDAVAETTTSEQIAAIEAAGASVLDEIPASYTDLSSNLITMQETQPTNEYNKMWIKNGTSYQVPTMDDFNSAISKDNISQTIFKGSDAAPANLNNDFFGVKPYNPSSANSPVANTYGAVQSFTANGTNWKYQVAFGTSGGVYVRKNINNGGWTAWEGLNTLETGTLTTTVLNDMYDKTVKKQGHIVNLLFTTNTGTSATININYTPVLATVPVGFRPPTTLFVPAVYYLNGTAATVTLASIGSNGAIGLLTQSGSTNIGYIRLMATYLV